MELPYEKEITEFLISYLNKSSISPDEIKKIFNIEGTTDSKLIQSFTDDEIQLGVDEYDTLYEMIQNLLIYKSKNDSENYNFWIEKMKEHMEFSSYKDLLQRYLEFEKSSILAW
jgi:hypothetical protein